MNTESTLTPKVWAGCLAAYNDGTLHGEWIDATDADEIREGINRVLKSSPIPHAEEHFFADYDGFPSAVVSALGEYAAPAMVAAVGSLLDTHGDAAIAWLEGESHYRLTNTDPDDLESDFDDAGVESAEDMGDWAYNFYVNCYGDPDKLEGGIAPYIDWNRMGRELLGDYSTSSVDGTLYIWRA